MAQQSFMKDMQGYAMTAGAVLGMPYQVILAQWALESTYGTSDLAQRANNFAGIKYNQHADFKSGSYAGYNSIASFVQDYIRVLQLPYYNGVRNAGGIKETIEEFGRSPYAEDPSYASKLSSIVNINDTSTGFTGNAVSAMGVLTNIATSPILWIVTFVYFLIKR
jgi:flagellum-specific peptidoglycan hydrolase FlgJ